MSHDLLTRVVFGEARGEGYTGMKAVADVAKNREGNTQLFRNAQTGKVDLQSVLTAKTAGGRHQFNTLDNKAHDAACAAAKSANTKEYQLASQAAQDAIKPNRQDSTGGSTAFDASRSSSTLQGNRWSSVEDVHKVGGHYFGRNVPTKK